MQNFLYNDTKISEAFSYNGASLWWFLFPEIFFALEKTLDFIENFSNDPNFQLVLKPHPREKSEEYQKILEIFLPKNAKIIQGNLLELLYISSLTVAINSSTIFDSFAMKKPVI